MTDTLLSLNKSQKCKLCGAAHIILNKCDGELLAKRINALLEANRAIPAIMEANKEAVTLAQHYQDLVRQAANAQDILFAVLDERGKVGEEIRNDYLHRLNQWANTIIDHGTKQLALVTESLTSKETNGKGSTEVTKIGDNSHLDS